MSLKLTRALKAIPKKKVERRVELLVKAGVIPATKRSRAIKRMRSNLSKRTIANRA